MLYLLFTNIFPPRPTHRNKKLLKRLDRMTNINPDLVGEFEFRFEQHVPSADDPLLFVPSGAHPVVNINLGVVDTTVKLKHLYVYSCQGGFDKTRELDRLRDTYNACYVTDPNNWMNIWTVCVTPTMLAT